MCASAESSAGLCPGCGPARRVSRGAGACCPQPAPSARSRCASASSAVAAQRLSTGCEQICAQPIPGCASGPRRAALSDARRSRRRRFGPAERRPLQGGQGGHPAQPKPSMRGIRSRKGVIVLNFLTHITMNLNAGARSCGSGRKAGTGGPFERGAAASQRSSDGCGTEKTLFFKGFCDSGPSGGRWRAHAAHAPRSRRIHGEIQAFGPACAGSRGLNRVRARLDRGQ